jgi:hypothetical protein
MAKKFLVVEGFGDFDSPASCWGVQLVDSFDSEEDAIEVSVSVWEDYVGGNDWKSFFVVVREAHELGGLVPACPVHCDASVMNSDNECNECLDDAHELEIRQRGK